MVLALTLRTGSSGCRQDSLATEETWIKKKERNKMRTVLPRSCLVLAIAAAPLIAGCATKSSVEMAQATANQALQVGQGAQAAAQGAQQRADQAQQTAQNAMAAAQTAQNTASQAQATATAAQQSATQAQASLDQARAAAREAIERSQVAARGPRG